MDAYDVQKAESFKRLGLTVECMAAYEDTLLTALKGGQIMQFEIEQVLDYNKNRQKVHLKRLKTLHFSEKPVSRIEMIPACSSLIAHTDNMLKVYNLDTLILTSSLPSTRGVIHFDITGKELPKTETASKDDKATIKICAAVGKQIKILEWNGDKFEEKKTDLVLSKPAKGLMWCGSRLFIGFQDEYIVLMPEKDLMMKEVFTYGTGQREPIMNRISRNRDLMLLGYTNKSIFVDRNGKPAKKFSINWSDIPRRIVHHSPYVTADLGKYLEIRSVDPTISIQRVDIKNAQDICKCRYAVFVATKNSLYILSLLPRADRVKHLIQKSQYPLATQIVMQSEAPEEERLKEAAAIRAQYGVSLFCKQKYVESMAEFLDLDVDPTHVVGMFPDMLPSKLQRSMEYPEKIPPLPKADIDRAYNALVDYLALKRKMIEAQEEFVPFTPILEIPKQNHTLKGKEQAFGVIDTTLLKCYLQTNGTLIAPLLKDPDNHVHLDEAKKVLNAHADYPDLILLYHQHNMHEEALGVLKDQSTNAKSSLHGTDAAIRYLQKLGEDHLKLICDNARWVLQVDPEKGLKIFTVEEPAVQNLPRGHVASFMGEVKTELAIAYLEHVVYEWCDMTEELHITLGIHLTDKVILLHQASLEGKVKEEGAMAKFEAKLMRFLEDTDLYKPELVITRFPLNYFFKERAVLLGRMHRHEQALGTYVHILEDNRSAEMYCEKYYDRDNLEDSDVFLYLLKVYLHPPPAHELGLSEYKSPRKPCITDALEVLEEHPTQIDLKKALEILPDDLRMGRKQEVGRKLAQYLVSALQNRVSYNNLCEVRRNIQLTEYRRLYEQRREYDCTSFTLLEDTVCSECKRRLNKSMFARHPNGDIVHYSCLKHNHTSVIG